MKNKILASIICLFMSLLVEVQYPSMYKDRVGVMYSSSLKLQYLCL